MEDVTRYVNISFLLAGLILCWVGIQLSEMCFGWAGPGADRVLFAGITLSTLVGIAAAAGATGYYWRNKKTYTLITEVAVELSKVTWPDWTETKRSTWVTIVFAIIVALFLALFDFIWKFATDAALSV